MSDTKVYGSILLQIWLVSSLFALIKVYTPIHFKGNESLLTDKEAR